MSGLPAKTHRPTMACVCLRRPLSERTMDTSAKRPGNYFNLFTFHGTRASTKSNVLEHYQFTKFVCHPTLRSIHNTERLQYVWRVIQVSIHDNLRFLGRIRWCDRSGESEIGTAGAGSVKTCTKPFVTTVRSRILEARSDSALFAPLSLRLEERPARAAVCF